MGDSRVRLVPLLAAVAALVAPASSNAATQIGQTFSPTSGCGADTYLQTNSLASSYAAPFDGLITSWSFQADADPSQLRLKVARPVGLNQFLIIGDTPLATPTPGALSTFPAHIAVQTGDVIGFYLRTSGACGKDAPPGFGHHFLLLTDPAPGATPTLTPSTGFQLDLSAQLERACTVPKVTRKTPKQARKRLRKAGCRVGKVRRSKKIRNKKQVVKQSVRPGGLAAVESEPIDLKVSRSG